MAISGPLEGRTIPVGQDAFRIGRHSDNQLQVLEIDVSRHHCELRRVGDQFTLRDLDSRHGTFVNNTPIRERILGHSDLVTVGRSSLLFMLDDSAEIASFSTTDGGGFVARTTVRVRPDDVALPDLRQLDSSTLPGRARMATELSALLEISTAMHALRSPDELAARLLELALDVIPAERGCVLLAEGDGGMHQAATRETRSKSREPFAASRTITEEVLSEKMGLLANDAETSQRFDDVESIRSAAVRSVLCVPLLSRERALGVLYFDTSSRTALFEQHHLELLTAASRIASLAFDNAFHLEQLRTENRRLREQELDHDIIGESPALAQVLDVVRRVAPTDSTVLILGESGTGKELAARAIHRSSSRCEATFVAINCATLSETLLESELFGHEKGAFTGAVARKVGKIEAANGGTLFLDEVGELPANLQAKLLRVLQQREFDRVGGTKPIRVDVRVIAATNRDLAQAMREHEFREDLFYRLNVISFTMPPLRERRDDIPLLARHFARLHSDRLNRHVTGLLPETRRALMAYDWPGNVRELGNAVERAIVLGEDELIRPEDLPDEVLEGGGTVESDYQTALLETKKRLIREAFEKGGDDYATAARILGIHVNSLHRLIRHLGIKEELGK